MAQALRGDIQRVRHYHLSQAKRQRPAAAYRARRAGQSPDQRGYRRTYPGSNRAQSRRGLYESRDRPPRLRYCGQQRPLTRDHSRNAGFFHDTSDRIEEMGRKRVVYQLPGMEQIPARGDIVFKTVGELALKMDLYSPIQQESGSLPPGVIFVSGGYASADTLRTREIGLYISYGQLVAAAGFVGITFDHRGLEGYTQLREVGEDTDDLIAYVRTN